MKVRIDRAGRLVIPKELRDRAGIVPGEVDIVVDGAGLRIEVEATDHHLVERDGHLLVDAGTGSDPALSDDLVRELRLADQK
jgi:AbrB family looped-hinge helix DNA binding protein